MRQFGLQKRLLSRQSCTRTEPFILRIGTGPPGSLPIVDSVTRSSSSLPVYPVNLAEMSPFEKDFAIRCYDYLSLAFDSRPSRYCTSILQRSSSASSTLEEACSRADVKSWCPLFDLILLPNGSLSVGWFRCHPLDEKWMRVAEDHVKHLWSNAPAALWLAAQETMHSAVKSQLAMRHRNSSIFLRANTMTSSQLLQALKGVTRATLLESGRTRLIESGVLRLSAEGKVTIADVESLMRDLETRNSELPTGTAIVFLRLLVSLAGRYGKRLPPALAEALQLSAMRVCALARVSICHQLLLSAAMLLRISPGTCNEPVPPELGDTVAQTLASTLRATTAFQSTHRDPDHRDYLESHLMAITETLAAEEHFLMDALAGNVPDAAEGSVDSSLDSPGSVVDGMAHSRTAPHHVSLALFNRALGRTEFHEAGEKLGAHHVARRSPLVFPAWLPGTGVDVRGCWSTLFVLVSALLAQAKKQSSEESTVAQLPSLAQAKQLHRQLRVSLTRRCMFATTETNAATQYSFLTLLLSSRAVPSASLTLLTLDSAEVSRELEALLDPHQQALMGLLFLFPSIVVGSFYGGVITDACASLASGTRQLRCITKQSPPHPFREREAGGVVQISQECAANLAVRLEKRQAALICVVHMGARVMDAFLAEDLPHHLSSIFQ